MRNFILTVALVLIAIPALAQQSKKLNPCTLLTKADVQDAVGAAKVADPALNESNGVACDFGVGDAGSVSIMVPPYSDWDQFQAQAKQMNIKITPAPNIGDRAYFADPGFGVQQIHSFKGKSYAIVTVSVPGLDAAKTREVAAKVMQKLLPRI